MQGLGPGTKRLSRDENALNLVKPVFYVAMGVEHLTYSFLPQFTYRGGRRRRPAVGLRLGGVHDLLSVLRADPDPGRPLCRTDRPASADGLWPGPGRGRPGRAHAAARGRRDHRRPGVCRHRPGHAVHRRAVLHPHRRLARAQDPGCRDHRLRLPGRHDLGHGDRLAPGRLHRHPGRVHPRRRGRRRDGRLRRASWCRRHRGGRGRARRLRSRAPPAGPGPQGDPVQPRPDDHHRSDRHPGQGGADRRDRVRPAPADDRSATTSRKTSARW